MRLFAAVLFLALASSQLAFAQDKTLTDDEIQSAIKWGKARKHSAWDGWGIGVETNDPHKDVWVTMYTPIEWIKWQSHLAAQDLKDYTPDKNDLSPVLRVEVTTVAQNFTRGCAQVSNVVLRDTKKQIAIQPTTSSPITDAYQNGFGAQLTCAGMIATFSMSDLEKVRSVDPKREFLISVATSRGGSDMKVKKGDFSHLD